MFRLNLAYTRKFTKDVNIGYLIELLDKVDTGAALAVAAFVGEIKYEYLYVIALARFITAGAIFMLVANQVCVLTRCRGPPVDSKRKILN